MWQPSPALQDVLVALQDVLDTVCRTLALNGHYLAVQVFKHHHEEATGRTSSIGQHTLCLDSRGGILNDTLFR